MLFCSPQLYRVTVAFLSARTSLAILRLTLSSTRRFCLPNCRSLDFLFFLQHSRVNSRAQVSNSSPWGPQCQRVFRIFSAPMVHLSHWLAKSTHLVLKALIDSWLKGNHKKLQILWPPGNSVWHPYSRVLCVPRRSAVTEIVKPACLASTVMPCICMILCIALLSHNWLMNTWCTGVPNKVLNDCIFSLLLFYWKCIFTFNILDFYIFILLYVHYIRLWFCSHFTGLSVEY